MSRQLQGTLTEQERLQLAAYLQNENNKEAVTETLAALLANQVPDKQYDSERFEPLLQAMLQADKLNVNNEPEAEETAIPSIALRQRRWWAVAALLLVTLGAGLFYFLINQPTKTTITPATIAARQDAEPGKEGAVLTLADGTKLVLDTLGNGVVARGNGMKVVLHNGVLAYETPGSNMGTMSYNTMSTPKGRQFKLVLPDGTRVWMNAASSITYPVFFEGNERKVEITGEVYFEVAKDAAKPFKVAVGNDMEVEVLGTHFNVNAHDDGDGLKTTLLEGAVKLKHHQEEVKLAPGQQAQVNNGKVQVKNKVDVDAVMAWKQGLFHFNKSDFASVMRQLERWYDVKVQYEGAIPPGTLTGDFPRTLMLSEVLHILELSGVQFKIENKNLIISNK